MMIELKQVYFQNAVQVHLYGETAAKQTRLVQNKALTPVESKNGHVPPEPVQQLYYDTAFRLFFLRVRGRTEIQIFTETGVSFQWLGAWEELLENLSQSIATIEGAVLDLRNQMDMQHNAIELHTAKVVNEAIEGLNREDPMPPLAPEFAVELEAQNSKKRKK